MASIEKKGISIVAGNLNSSRSYLIAAVGIRTFQMYISRSALNLAEPNTLDSGINIGLRLVIFGIFSRGYILIRG